MSPKPTLSREAEQAKRRLYGLSLIGTALFFAGAFIYFAGDRSSYGAERRAYICDYNNQADTVEPILWPLWIVMVLLAVGASSLYRRHLRSHGPSQVLMQLGVLGAIASCPVLAIIAVVMECGL